MNVKGVDLQFAIHKNDEAGMKQNQLMQRPIHDQALLGHEAAQALQKERTRTGKVSESAGRRIGADQEEKEQSKQGQRQDGKRAQPPKPEDDSREGEMAKHPYKGRHIDLTL